MWFVWVALGAVCVAGVESKGEKGGALAIEGGVATTRQPPRTLDRQAGELAWRNWLKSPENRNPNQPPRRITTKSLFITPLVCPKGHRLDKDGCVEVLTVNKDDHERVLLEQFNALFQARPAEDVNYDYGDEQPGPLQLSIPIGIEPQPVPLMASEPMSQAQDASKDLIKNDKKEQDNINTDAGLEAELELMKLQNNGNKKNHTEPNHSSDKNKLSNSPLMNLLFHSEKPKRENAAMNETSPIETTTDAGQKEQIYGQVNVDPILYDEPSGKLNLLETTGKAEETTTTTTDFTTETATDTTAPIETETHLSPVAERLTTNIHELTNKTILHVLKKDKDKNKLNPESDYADIGEAIKIISRYAEVTTDDSFAREQNKHASKDDDVLGTRTKMQYRNRNRPKSVATDQAESNVVPNKDLEPPSLYPKGEIFYRYPWVAQGSPTPPPGYPFRHLQDYWQGKHQIQGLYNPPHENPRRHHHALLHTSYNNHGQYINPLAVLGDYYHIQEPHAEKKSEHIPRYQDSVQDTITHKNQDLYSLLGLRHWFSTEGATKR